MKPRFRSFWAERPHEKLNTSHLFGVIKHAILHPLTWVVIGILMLFTGLILHTQLGVLLFLVGLLLAPASLFLWFTNLMRRTPLLTNSTDEREKPVENLPPQPVENQAISSPDTNSETQFPQSPLEALAPPPKNEDLEKEQAQGPAIRLRIQEEPLTALHLVATLDAFLSLYVKMWLLQQKRFVDFVSYSTKRDTRFEEEANLLIAELKHNSPADIIALLVDAFKGLAEAFQIIVDTITQLKSRMQLKQAEVIQANLNNVEHVLKILPELLKVVDTLYPGLSEDERKYAILSLANPILGLVKIPTLEITFLAAPSSISAPHKALSANAKHEQPLSIPVASIETAEREREAVIMRPR